MSVTNHLHKRQSENIIFISTDADAYLRPFWYKITPHYIYISRKQG